MKRYIKLTLPALALAGLVFTACQPELDVPEASAGSANFGKYVALGNSLTAGYAGNALYREGQEVSYPNLLAQQFMLAGGGEFKQPLLAANIRFGNPNTDSAALGRIRVPQELKLGYSTNCLGITSLGPVRAGADLSMALGQFPSWLNDTKPTAAGPYQNLGVPGAKTIDVIRPGYGNPNNILNPNLGNPYYIRFATTATTSILNDAITQNPTFFTYWVGNNDVLLNALSGGSGGSVNAITPMADFSAAVDTALTRLTRNGAKGAVANIPDLLTLPFFSLVPYNGLVLTRQGQVDSLNMAYSQLGITFQLGQNPFIINDPSAPGARRKIRATERILLSVPQDQMRCAGLGSVTPLENKYVLTDNELATIAAATDNFNAKLRQAATDKGLAFVDMNTYIRSLQPGQANSTVLSYTVANTAEFVRGNLFSLDGIHLSPRGNALVANKFIEEINRTYGSTVPYLNINNYEGVRFP